MLPAGVVKGVSRDAKSMARFGHSLAITFLLIVAANVCAMEPIGASSSSNECVLAEWDALQAASPDLGRDFGGSMDLKEDWLIVGAPIDGDLWEGAVYIFRRDDRGTASSIDDLWVQAAKLVEPDPHTTSSFGSSVAIDRDWAVVGDPDRRGRLYFGEGAAYLFRRDDGGTPTDFSDDTWPFFLKFTAAEHIAENSFGRDVQLDADWLVIGNPRDQSDCPAGPRCNLRSALMFRRESQGTLQTVDDAWVLHQTLTPTETTGGGALLLATPYLVISRPSDNGGAGAVYVYALDRLMTPDPADDVWGQLTKLHASDPTSSAQFGGDMAMEKANIAVGALLARVDGQATGAVYMFRGADGSTAIDPLDDTWAEVGKVYAADGQENDYFGISLALTADRLAVGAPRISFPGPGFGYVFELDWEQQSVEWSQVAKIVPTGSSDSDWFGWSVRATSDFTFFASPYDALNQEHGSVYRVATQGRCEALNDFAAFQKCFGAELPHSECSRFDFDQNTEVDSFDLRFLVHHLVGP